MSGTKRLRTWKERSVMGQNVTTGAVVQNDPAALRLMIKLGKKARHDMVVERVVTTHYVYE